MGFDLQVLVEGPKTGVPRQEMSLKRLHLTTMTMHYPWHAPSRVVKKAWEDAGIDEKWEQSRWAKRVAARKIVSFSFLNKFCRNASLVMMIQIIGIAG